jgi:hypothetical protein
MRKLFVLVGAAVTLLAMSSPAAASSTTCNSTTAMTGAVISGDLVVPDNGTCIIENSTVGDDVRVGQNAYFEANNSQIADDVEANKSLTVFLHDGSTVGDRVEANQTAQVFLFDSTIGGRLEIWRTTQTVNICGNQLGGSVQVQKSGTDILFGDPLTIGCPGNTVLNGKSVKIHSNFTDVELVIRGNTVQGGDLEVFNNKGPSGKFVEGNIGGDELDCFGNEQPFSSKDNTNWDEQEGQCAIPDTECNSPNPQTVNTLGDLVVPENGVCIIVGSTVGDDVKVGKNAYFESRSSQIHDDVKGSKSQTVFIDDGTTVGGDVKTSKTAQVFLFNSNLNGTVDVSRSTDQVFVCGNQIGEDVRIADSARDILFGDPSPGVDCAGNTVADGDVRIERNNTDVELVIRGNTVQQGDMKVLDNRGPADKFVENNIGGDELVCKGNEQPFTSGGNTGWDEQIGQCAIPPTECNSPNPQTVNTAGDLVVPENGVCIIVGSNVGDDVKVSKGGYFEASASGIGDDLQASKALTVFLHDGTKVGDDIESSKTAQVFLFDSTLNGPVGISGTTDRVNLCGNTIDGDVRVADSGRDILIGDPTPGVDCGGNTLLNGHSLKATDNSTDVEFVIRGNTFTGGNLGVFDNEGPSDKFVQDNSGGNELKCFGNATPFVGTPNGFTSEQGQCAEI